MSYTTAQRRAFVRDSLRKRREKLLAAGICRDCGKLPVKPDRTMCQPCIDYRGRHRRFGQCRPLPVENQSRIERMLELSGRF